MIKVSFHSPQQFQASFYTDKNVILKRLMRLHYSNCSLLTVFAGHLSSLVARGPNICSARILAHPRAGGSKGTSFCHSWVSLVHALLFPLTFLTCFFSATFSSLLPLPIKDLFCQCAGLWLMLCFENVLNTKKNRE